MILIKKLNTTADYFDKQVGMFSQELLSAPLLNSINNLSLEELKYFFSQIYYFVDIFPGLMGIMLFKVKENNIKMLITENILDEFGGEQNIKARNQSGMHSQLLRNFINKLSTENSNALSIAGNATNNLLKEFEDFFLKSSEFELMASVAAMECISTEWFQLLYSQLKTLNLFSDDDLHFFTLHICLDEEHGDILKEAILPKLSTKENKLMFEKAIFTTSSIWLKFYKNLVIEMPRIVNEDIKI